MKIILDSSTINEIKDSISFDMIDGFNLNPNILQKENKEINKILNEISILTDLPVFFDIFTTDYNEVLNQIKNLKKTYSNLCFKLPFSAINIKLCKELSDEGLPIEISYCTTSAHCILAAKAGAVSVSLFVSLIEDFSFSGIETVKEVKTIYENYPEYQTEIKAFGVKNALDLSECFKIGIDSCVISFRTLNYILANPLAESLTKKFKI